MEIQFFQQRALVTGASGGIGSEIVKELLKCNAQVIALDMNKEGLESLKEELPSIEIVVVDLTDWAATEAAVKNIPNLDLLVNCAGIAIPELLLDTPMEHVNKLFDINIKAVINLTQIFAKQLIARNAPGSIVNISSQASLRGLKFHSVYCGSKGAVDSFSRAAALELGPYKIRVNCVNPTIIMTAMGRLCWTDPEKADPMLARIPLGRFGEVQEVVNAVIFLLSDKASMITGTCLPVDGGFVSS